MDTKDSTLKEEMGEDAQPLLNMLSVVASAEAMKLKTDKQFEQIVLPVPGDSIVSTEPETSAQLQLVPDEAATDNYQEGVDIHTFETEISNIENGQQQLLVHIVDADGNVVDTHHNVVLSSAVADDTNISVNNLVEITSDQTIHSETVMTVPSDGYAFKTGSTVDHAALQQLYDATVQEHSEVDTEPFTGKIFFLTNIRYGCCTYVGTEAGCKSYWIGKGEEVPDDSSKVICLVQKQLGLKLYVPGFRSHVKRFKINNDMVFYVTTSYNEVIHVHLLQALYEIANFGTLKMGFKFVTGKQHSTGEMKLFEVDDDGSIKLRAGLIEDEVEEKEKLQCKKTKIESAKLQKQQNAKEKRELKKVMKEQGNPQNKDGIISETSNNTVPLVKRGRGRPRKIHLLEEVPPIRVVGQLSLTAGQSPGDTNILEKGSRSVRKRTVRAEYAEYMNSVKNVKQTSIEFPQFLTSNSDDNQEVRQETNSKVLKRPVGRPRKKIKTEPLEEVSITSTPSMSVEQPQPCGRSTSEGDKSGEVIDSDVSVVISHEENTDSASLGSKVEETHIQIHVVSNKLDEMTPEANASMLKKLVRQRKQMLLRDEVGPSSFHETEEPANELSVLRNCVPKKQCWKYNDKIKQNKVLSLCGWFIKSKKAAKYKCQKCLFPHKDEGSCFHVYPKHVIHNQTDCENTSVGFLKTLPSELSMKLNSNRNLTVCAAIDIECYTQFGPVIGEVIPEETVTKQTNLSHIWFLRGDDTKKKKVPTATLR